MKDAALEGVAKWVANHYGLKRFGRIEELKLDSTTEEIFVVLELHGEETPIEMTMPYKVAGPTQVEIGVVKASRQWIEEVINHVIPAEKKSLTVPLAVTKALSKVIK